MTEETLQILQTANPFGSNRVDTPFQKHPDLSKLYHEQSERLKAILSDIKDDANHQSVGAVIIGEAGAGKTHLIMRLAQERMKNNRLLFIRHPNNSRAVIYHIYSRILESFAEKIPDTEYTQLERLLANSFVKILGEIPYFRNTEKGKNILNSLQENSLSLYKRFDTDKQTNAWLVIEREILRWWAKNYYEASYSITILKGIVKFCRYAPDVDNRNHKDIVRRWLAGIEIPEEDINKVGLENWRADINLEEFALEAIAVFAKLSILDEPLIIVFDQLEVLKERAGLLKSFGNAIKEIFTHVPNSLLIFNLFPDRWQHFQNFFDGSIIDRISQRQVHLHLPDREDLIDILQMKLKDDRRIKDLFNDDQLDDILSQKSIRAVINLANAYATGITPPSPPPPPQPDDFEIRLKRLENQFNDLQASIDQLILGGLLDTGDTGGTGDTGDTGGINPPLEQYLLEKRAELKKEYDQPIIITESDDFGKLLEIGNAFQILKSIEFNQMKLGKRTLPEHCHLIIKSREYVIGFLHSSGAAFASRIKNFNELVISYPNVKFSLIRDQRESAISGKVGKEEIDKLNHTKNGQFVTMDKSDRLNFELIYNLIIDIDNQDLDVNMTTALKKVAEKMSDYWLINILMGT